MSQRPIRTTCGLYAAALLLPACAAPRAAESARVVTDRPLPPLDGTHLTLTTVEVTYPPGGGSPPHRHACPVTGYVISGALRTRTGAGTERVVRAGEGFAETPADAHETSANASRREPVRFLATFVCDHDAPRSSPLTPADTGATP